MGKIYKIVNIINDKIYVGKTIHSLEARFKDHIRCAIRWQREEEQGLPHQHVSHLYRAMNKYGYDNFSIELIEEVSDDEIDEKERYYIRILNSQKEGYNIHEGGAGGKTWIDKPRQPTEKQLKALEAGQHRPASDKLKKRLSEIRTNCIVSEETRKKLRGCSLNRVRIHKEQQNKNVKKDTLQEYLDNGWELGYHK